MTLLPNGNDSDEFNDPEFLALLASLDLGQVDQGSASTPPPRTPSPRPPSYVDARHTFPSDRPRTTQAAVVPSAYTPTRRLHNSPVQHYYYDSPTRSGHTTEWSVAGTATQGVPGAHVRGVSPRKKKTKKAAYVVFCGRRCGVFETWSQTKPLVDGVRNCIFRGYTTLEAAESAFAYAVVRSWTRTSDSALSTTLLPQPIDAQPRNNIHNPLNHSEALDDRWYVVYRGIFPGVYRSHLECQLNVLGVRRALHESVHGRDTAFSKYQEALAARRVSALAPTYYAGGHDDDPFV
ncbi:hypothetical protein C8F04DRAFT_1265439 [Mycena alexandri]|uniref:Ribonuclease H1 N-terminal domain-containing protein n=1 Tax=Mycena alexandri TaxID=1745969 RepID=A0AAD6SK21_9AGAR|nr:hypothetical protein C8F04DRAFT_1265439 [Mycena alexandri]